jgi:hypothetical protein
MKIGRDEVINIKKLQLLKNILQILIFILEKDLSLLKKLEN